MTTYGESFISLLKQKPIDKISVTELCQAANVNRGSFYAHYADVYDLLGQIESIVYERLCNAVRNCNYTKSDFALHHPAGALGKKLLVKVENIMHTGAENAVIPEGSTLRKAIVEMSSKGLSMVTVVDTESKLKGIITDGDLRRMLERGVDVYNEIVDNVMTKSPKFIDHRDMAVNALQKMSDLRITGMPVLDEDGCVVGSVLMQDIYKAGIVR